MTAPLAATPLELTSTSPAETHHFGEALGRLLQPGDLVTLSGELGAGKTALAQGIGAGLGVTEPVSSPTFALVHEYQGRMTVWHLDVYRVRSLDELIDLSWQDLLRGAGVVIVEWPERISEALPAERLDIVMEHVDESTRRIRVAPLGDRMANVASQLEPQP